MNRDPQVLKNSNNYDRKSRCRAKFEINENIVTHFFAPFHIIVEGVGDMLMFPLCHFFKTYSFFIIRFSISSLSLPISRSSQCHFFLYFIFLTIA